MLRCLTLAVTGCLVILTSPLLAAPPQVTESLSSRVRVLYLASGQGPIYSYPALEFLERSTNLRFIYQRDSDPACSGEEEGAQVTDGILWDNDTWPDQRAARLERLRKILARRQFEAVVLDGKKFAPDTAEAIVAYVKSGGHAVWLGSQAVTEGALAELCPLVEKKDRPKKEEAVPPGADSAYTCGFPLGEMVDLARLQPAAFKPEVTALAQTAPTGLAVVGLMRVGKGDVLAVNVSPMVPVRHQYGSPMGVDTDFLWGRFWEQVGKVWKEGEKAYAVQAEVSITLPSAAAGETVPVEVRLRRRGGTEARKVRVTLEDPGTAVMVRQQLAPTAAKAAAALAVPAAAQSGKYRVLVSLLGPGDGLLHEAYGFVSITGPLSVTLTSDQSGYAVGETVRLIGALKGEPPVEAQATLQILDGMGLVVHAETRKLRSGADQSLDFAWTMPDYGPEGWAFRAYLTVQDAGGKRLASADRWFWRYQPYTFREKFLFNNWWGGADSVPSALMPLYALYHRGIGFNGAMWWGEPYFSRFNMRAWYPWSATVMENFTSNFTAKDFSQQGNMGWIKAHMLTAAYVLHDFGEETGFYYHWSNNPCEIKWKNDADIPEGGHRFFRMYLQEKYGTIAKLNEQWGTNYGSFEEVKLQSKWGRPAGWLFLPPAQDVPRNIAPYLDAHGFFFWYCTQAFEASMEAVHSVNPVPDWGMSFSLTFNLFSPVPMTQHSPFYHGTLATAWNSHAVQRSRGGNTPLFSFHWGFDEDYPTWGQFWNQNLASLCTLQPNWGGMWNYDLTHSRSTMYFKRLMAQVRPREQAFLSCYPTEEYSVGIYHPDLDWQTVHSRPGFFLFPQGPKSQLAGQMGYKAMGVGWLGGPEFQVYNALSASGYDPRWVTEEEIPRCKVLFVPYVETMPESAAAAIRAFVNAGGSLVTLPLLASHNGYGKPYPEQPGGGLAEVLGLTVQGPWIGPRNVVNPPSDKDSPIQWSFPGRPGGEPAYLWSYAHQQVTPGPETKVLATHDDGNAAVTWHRYGQGQAIHLNWYTLDDMSQEYLDHFQNESLREWLDNLVRAAGVTPPLFVSRPWYGNEGAPLVAQYHYRLKDSGIRCLALFNDKTNARQVLQVNLYESVAEVRDLLTGEEVPLRALVGQEFVEVVDPFSFEKSRQAGSPVAVTFPVVMSPGDVAFFALVPYRTGRAGAALGKARLAAGEDLSVRVTLSRADGKPIPDSHPVHVDVLSPTGDRLPMLCRRVTLPAEGTVTIPTRLGDPPGKWTIRVTDCLNGASTSHALEVASNPRAAGLPAVSEVCYPSSRLGKIGISEAEFTTLLGALDSLYRSGGERDKGSLSFYCFDRDLSRHRIMKLLNEADWLQMVPALRRYVESGHEVILLGEDLGWDPSSGLTTDPMNGAGQDEGTDMAAGGALPGLAGARKLQALEKVTGRSLRGAWPGGRLVIPLGKGRLILDAGSLDDQGMANGEFAVNHARWLKTLPE